MKIAIAGSQLAATKSVTGCRYLSIMDDYGFAKMSVWHGRGIQDNVCGQGKYGEGFSHEMIPCVIPFTGKSSKVTISAKVWMSSTNNVFCWAIDPYGLDYLYKGVGPVSGGTALAQGKFAVANGATSIQTFTFPIQNLPNDGTFYIYLWRSNSGYGNFHIFSDWTVSVYTETDTVSWKNATPYVYDGTAWKQATPYVRNRYREWIRAL